VNGSGTSNQRFMTADGSADEGRSKGSAPLDGSIILLTDSQGDVVAQNRYDADGNPHSGHIGRFGFTGQTRISGTSLWHD
jgi:hypothetical protein